MPNTAIPVCPFLSANGQMKPCLDNCPLNIKGKCSFKVIAEALEGAAVVPYTDDAK